MKLAKVPPNIINANNNLTDCWYIILNLQGKNESLISEIIKFLKGIFQSDSPSVLLFVLALSSLSFISRKEKVYLLEKCKIAKHTHKVFVDDLKLFATTRATIVKQLDIVTNFSEDIGTKFGEDKCASLQIERG